MGENWPGPDNTIGYTGYDYDAVSNLYYAQARYYMPEIGRFISEDPWPGTIAEPTTMNPYPYVKNNPLRYIDPTGMVVASPPTDGYFDDDNVGGPDDDDTGSTGGNNGGGNSGGGNTGGGNTGGGDTGGTGGTGDNDDVVEEVSRGIISKGIGGAIDGICNFIGKRSAIDNVQLGLDVLGMAPVVGEVFDVINAGIYLARGDYKNAGLSALGAIPLLGNLTSGSKLAIKVGAAAGGAAGTGLALRKFGKVFTKNVDKVDEVADVGKRMGKMDLQMFAGKSKSKVDNIVQTNRRKSFRNAKLNSGIPTSAQYNKHKYIYDGTSENRLVYEFDVEGSKKYIIEHVDDKFGRGPHFHGADSLKGSPFDKGRYNQYPGHFPENFNGYRR